MECVFSGNTEANSNIKLLGVWINADGTAVFYCSYA